MVKCGRGDGIVQSSWRASGSTGGSEYPTTALSRQYAALSVFIERHDDMLESARHVCIYALISAVAAAGRASARSQAPDAVDASGIATLRVLFRHAAAPAPDAQAGPP